MELHESERNWEIGTRRQSAQRIIWALFIELHESERNWEIGLCTPFSPYLNPPMVAIQHYLRGDIGVKVITSLSMVINYKLR